MNGLDIIKYLIGLATTLLAIYGLTNDFKKEIKHEDGTVIKKITRSGWINIIVLLILSVSTIGISITEKKRSNEEKKNNKEISKKLEDLQKVRHQETQQGLNDNLKEAKAIVETLREYSNLSLENQNKFKEELEKSIETVNDFEYAMDYSFNELSSNISEFDKNIAYTTNTITEFKREYENNKDVFDGIYMSGHAKINFEIPLSVSFIHPIISEIDTWYSSEGEEYFSSYLDMINKLRMTEYINGLHREIDSVDLLTCLRQIAFWIGKRGMTTINYYDLQKDLNQLIFSDANDKVYTGLYLKAITDKLLHEVNNIDEWSVYMKVQYKRFEPFDNFRSDSMSDFIFSNNKGFNISMIGYSELPRGFVISDLAFTPNGIEFNFDFEFSVKSGFVLNDVSENSFRISEMSGIELKFQSDLIDYGDLIQGEITLNNSLSSKFSFTGTHSFVDID